MMSRLPLLLLLVEDSEWDAELVLAQLRESGYEPTTVRVEDAEAFQRELASRPWDLIISDYKLPTFSGMEALALYRKSGADIPFLLVSGLVGEETAVAAMRAGARDYLLKDHLARLGPAVARELQERELRRQRQQDRQRAVASQRRFAAIFENSPVATIIADVETGTIFDLNPAALLLIGRRYEHAVGHTTIDLGLWSDQAERSRLLPTALAAGPGHAIERRLHPAGRPTATVLASFSLIELDGQDRVLVMMQDITQRKHADETLRESEERYRLLVENSHDLVAEIDAQGILLYLSPNYSSVTGYTPAELLGARALDFVHPDDQGAIAVHLESREGPARSRYRFRHRSGEWLSFESTGRVFRTSSGIRRGVMITRDRTEQERAEEIRWALEAQLRQSHKMEAIGTLAGGIAHDFNNILTAIFGYVQLAEMELPPEHAVRPYLSGVMQGSERARDLVAQILTFSRRREQQRAVAKPAPIIRDALRLLRASLPATIVFDVQVDEQAPAVLCDSTQLQQLLMNLGANAAYAMREGGGTFTVRLHEAAPEPAILAAHPQFRHRRPVCLSLADTGAGMSPETRERIFEPFFTTKPFGEGTGLGLSVVHGIVQNHEGAVLCDSEPGRGTTFRIYLPTVDLEDTQATRLDFELPQGHGQRVLVVDDEDAVVAIAKRMLERLGYQPTVFNDARAALDELDRNAGGYDLLLTDLTMSGLTGVDLAREARQRRPELPVIIATGFMNVREVDAARTLGVTDFLEKPFALASLAQSLRRALPATAAQPTARSEARPPR